MGVYTVTPDDERGDPASEQHARDWQKWVEAGKPGLASGVSEGVAMQAWTDRQQIETDYDPAYFKPKSHWWTAKSVNYCGCEDCHGSVYPVGYGETEAEAIADYNQQMEDRA